MGYFILGFPGDREYLLGRLTHELTEYFTALLLLISTLANTGFDQDGIHNAKYDDDIVMADVNESE